ncbi:restriction endonuclease subunit S [Alishewanella sp. HL-SH05]|uniref:restriction endonuclease subunit S n=1 Tax=Alishewanella sp. HL-SH05 TaxID=3461145 RepID=UPI0040411581
MSEKQTVQFGDIAEQILERVHPQQGDEKKFIGLQHLISGNLAVYEWGGDVELSAQAFKVAKGDIIFARRNTYLKRVAISPIDGICSGDAMVIRPIAGLIEPSFLPFFMQSEAFMNRVISISAGSLSSRVKWKDLAIQKFTIPSLDEQRKQLKILEKIEQIQSVRREGRFSLDRLKRSLRRSLFSGFGFSELFKETPIGKIPVH